MNFLLTRLVLSQEQNNTWMTTRANWQLKNNLAVKLLKESKHYKTIRLILIACTLIFAFHSLLLFITLPVL